MLACKLGTSKFCGRPALLLCRREPAALEPDSFLAFNGSSGSRHIANCRRLMQLGRRIIWIETIQHSMLVLSLLVLKFCN